MCGQCGYSRVLGMSVAGGEHWAACDTPGPGGAGTPGQSRAGSPRAGPGQITPRCQQQPGQIPDTRKIGCNNYLVAITGMLDNAHHASGASPIRQHMMTIWTLNWCDASFNIQLDFNIVLLVLMFYSVVCLRMLLEQVRCSTQHSALSSLAAILNASLQHPDLGPVSRCPAHHARVLGQNLPQSSTVIF